MTNVIQPSSGSSPPSQEKPTDENVTQPTPSAPPSFIKKTSVIVKMRIMSQEEKARDEEQAKN